MSTKLYNGIKFKSNKLSEVIRQLHGLKEEAKENVMKTFQDKESLNFILMSFLYNKAKNENEKISCWDFERLLRNELRRPYNDFYFEFGVSIFERKNKLYGIYYDQSRDNYKMLFNRGIAVDYHYQDQTDKPEGISNRDWYFREEVWSDIFDDISCLWIPSEAGVEYRIVGVDDIYVTDEMIKDIIEMTREMEDKNE
jgi:hypothetical protein